MKRLWNWITRKCYPSPVNCKVKSEYRRYFDVLMESTSNLYIAQEGDVVVKTCHRCDKDFEIIDKYPVQGFESVKMPKSHWNDMNEHGYIKSGSTYKVIKQNKPDK